MIDKQLSACTKSKMLGLNFGSSVKIKVWALSAKGKIKHNNMCMHYISIVNSPFPLLMFYMEVISDIATFLFIVFQIHPHACKLESCSNEPTTSQNTHKAILYYIIPRYFPQSVSASHVQQNAFLASILSLLPSSVDLNPELPRAFSAGTWTNMLDASHSPSNSQFPLSQNHTVDFLSSACPIRV